MIRVEIIIYNEKYFKEVNNKTKNKEKKTNKKEVLKRLHAEYNRILEEQSLTDICDPRYVELDELAEKKSKQIKDVETDGKIGSAIIGAIGGMAASCITFGSLIYSERKKDRRMEMISEYEDTDTAVKSSSKQAIKDGLK